MNSPKNRILDIKVMLSKCAIIDDPILLRSVLTECVALLDNVDISIEKAVEQLKILFHHIKLNIQVNTDVKISKELYEFIKYRITEIQSNSELVSIIFNSDDCIINGISVIDSYNLTNTIKDNKHKLILIADDSSFNLKMIFNKLKILLFPSYHGLTPNFDNNYTTFEIDEYLLVFVKNGKIGFDVFKTIIPYAIITDNDMPFMNGHDMSNLILSSNSESKILMISGNSSNTVEDLFNLYPQRFKFLCKGSTNLTFFDTFNELFSR